MLKYVIRNLAQMIVTLFGITILVFVLNYMIGDPVGALLGPEATREARETFRHQMGFDRPVLVQYFDFAIHAAQGDFGKSYRMPGYAMQYVMEAMPATLLLAVTGMGIAVLLSIPLGIISAYRRGSIIDNLASVISILGQSMPIFWLGLMLIILFAVQLRWLPASGYGTPAHLVMPAFCLGVFTAPVSMRLVRSGMLEVLNMDYVRTARAKGLAERFVLIQHALRNTMIPVVTVLGIQFGQLLGGAIMAETVFAWPGVAQLAVEAILQADFPIVQSAVITLAVIITVVNLATDLTVGFLDPRIRLA
jgi:peptide/nickel transport system permease protein